MSKPQDIIEAMRLEGKLSALPIGPVNWIDGTVESFDGRSFMPYGSDGTWVECKQVQTGDIRYLGSASHAGKIEFKALYVFVDNLWYNILNGKPSKPLTNEEIWKSRSKS